MVEGKGLRHLHFHGENRVQGGHGLLEDHGDFGAAQLLQLLFAQAEQVLFPLAAVIADGAAGNGQGIGQQAQHGVGGDGLAAAGFADDAEGAFFPDGQVDLVQQAHGFFAAEGGDFEVSDFQQIVHPGPSLQLELRVQHVPQRVA